MHACTHNKSKHTHKHTNIVAYKHRRTHLHTHTHIHIHTHTHTDHPSLLWIFLHAFSCRYCCSSCELFITFPSHSLRFSFASIGILGFSTSTKLFIYSCV